MIKIKPEFIRLTSEQRMCCVERPIVALTGGIATGKSTVSKLLRLKGFEIIDADQLIHQIYQKPETIDFLKNLAPEVIKLTGSDTSVDFKLLRQLFFTNPLLKQNLLAFLYPRMVPEFLAAAKKIQSDVLIYDVPMLYERNLEKLVDFVVCVYCPRATQVERLAARDKSSPKLIDEILKQQIDIEIKRQQSNYVIQNTEGMDQLTDAVQAFINYTFV